MRTCVEVDCTNPCATFSARGTRFYRSRCRPCHNKRMRLINTRKECSVEGCERLRHGLCSICAGHDWRLRVYGDMLIEIPLVDDQPHYPAGHAKRGEYAACLPELQRRMISELP